jgi:UDP-glucose 4-epimerase
MIGAMKNILVTGGAGYIGSHTVVELINAGYRPVIVDNFTNSEKAVIERLKKLTEKDIVCYKQDFQNKVKLKSVINNEKIDGVIHFAAYKAVGESVQEPIKYYDNNVAGLIKLLEVLEENKIPNLVFSSSCTVYGEPDKLPITENASVKPATSPYGATKQMCETIIRDVSHASETMRSLSLRYFNPIGAHESAEIGERPIGTPANLVPFITQAAAGLRGGLTVHGSDYPTPDGTCIRDYIHVVDLAKAHVKTLQHLQKQKPKYYDFCNIGTGKGNSVLDVIKTFEKVTGQKVPYKIGERRDGDIMAVYADVTKSKKMLGWQAEKNLADALKDAWRWQQNILKIN